LPFVIESNCNNVVTELYGLYAQILGLEAQLIKECFPNEYNANHDLYGGAEDCIYPTPEAQQKHPNVEDGVYWGLHQVALRKMGMETSDADRAKQRMAWHVDQSDVKSNQILTFLPMGGRNGKGGHVQDSDLMVFEHEKGGKSFRLNTSVEDTVVFILMNSGKQLHGSAMDDTCKLGRQSFCWSARFIAYGRNNVLHFTNGRKEGKRHGLAFRQRKMRNHRPLCKETVMVGDRVLAFFGKKKKLLPATLIISDNELHFQWDCDGTKTKCNKSNFYNVVCAEKTQVNECRYCNPVPDRITR
jgi:hypothetical protein